LLDDEEIGGRLDDAQQHRVAFPRPAERAQNILGERIAALAVADGLRRAFERIGESYGAGAIVLQQMSAIRCAAFGPTPGSERNACASSSSPDSGSATGNRRATG
jgi:hypothetical protein